jgi:hypothetical protein
MTLGAVVLSAGFDVELRPFQHKTAQGPDGATVTIGVSAIRRLVARQIAENVRSVARNWSKSIQQLSLPLSVV